MLYGPESATFAQASYDTVTWVWAAMLTVMVTEHRRRWERSDYDEPTDSSLVAAFQALIRNAAAAE